MNYPVEYTVIAENEKIYIEGGADYWGLFNYLIGDYLRDAVLSETRSAVWSSAKKGSTEPLQNPLSRRTKRMKRHLSPSQMRNWNSCSAASSRWTA